jgi:hypothetical protein
MELAEAALGAGGQVCVSTCLGASDTAPNFDAGSGLGEELNVFFAFIAP